MQHIGRIDRLREGVPDPAGKNGVFQVFRLDGTDCFLHQVAEVTIFILPVHACGHWGTTWNQKRGSCRLNGFGPLSRQQVPHKALAAIVRLHLQAWKNPTPSAERHPSGAAFHCGVKPTPSDHRRVGHQASQRIQCDVIDPVPSQGSVHPGNGPAGT